MSISNHFVFVGHNVTLCCNVTASDRDVNALDDVTFKSPRQDLLIGGRWWSDDRSTVCASVEVTEAPRVIYYCLVQDRSTTAGGGSIEACLGYRLLQSDYSPRSALNNVSLDCVKTSIRFTCTFDNLKTVFAQPERAQLAVLYRNDEIDDVDKACKQKCTEQECMCTLDQGKDFSMTKDSRVRWTLIVNYTNDLGGVFTSETSRVFTVMPWHLEKIPPPSSVHVRSATARSMVVEWRRGSGPQLCALSLMPPRRNTSLQVEEKQITVALNPHTLAPKKRVDDLTPFTVYNVTIKCRPPYSSLWSDVITTSAKTTMATPVVSPLLSPGYSYIDHKNHIAFFWKPLSENEANGPGLRYHVTIGGSGESRDNTKTSEYVRHTHVTNNTYAIFSSLDLVQGSVVAVGVRAVNEAGPSNSMSVLHVDLTPGHMIHDVRAILEGEWQEMITLNITWSPASQHVESYSVLACWRQDYSSNLCQGDVKWRTVPGHRTWSSHQLSAHLPLPALIYGVTAHYHVAQVKVTSGFHFWSCILRRYEGGALGQVVGTGCQDQTKARRDYDAKQVAPIVVLTICILLFVICGVGLVRSKYRNTARRFALSIPQQLEQDWDSLPPNPCDLVATSAKKPVLTLTSEDYTSDEQPYVADCISYETHAGRPSSEGSDSDPWLSSSVTQAADHSEDGHSSTLSTGEDLSSLLSWSDSQDARRHSVCQERYPAL